MGVCMGFTGYPDPEIIERIDKLSEPDVAVFVRTLGLPVSYRVVDEEASVPEKIGVVFIEDGRDVSSFRRILLWKKELIRNGWEITHTLSAVIDLDANKLIGLSLIDKYKHLHKPRKLVEIEIMYFFNMLKYKAIRAGFKNGEKMYEEEWNWVYEPESVWLVERLEQWTKNHPEYKKWMSILAQSMQT